MKKILLILVLLFAFCPTVTAQGNYPKLNGCVADNLGKLNVVDVNATCDRLARGNNVKPVVLVYQEGTNNSVYDDGFARSIGLGPVPLNNQAGFQTNAVLIRLAFTPTGVKTRIYYGASLAKSLDPKIEAIDNAPGDPVMSNPTLGVQNRLNAIAQALQPTPPAPQVVQVQQTNVDTSGIGNFFLILLLIAVIAGAGYVFIVYVMPALQSRQQLETKLKNLRESETRAVNSLQARMGTGDINQDEKLKFGLLKMDQPTSEKMTSEYRQKSDQITLLFEESKELTDQTANLISLQPAALRDLITKYTTLSAKRRSVESWLEKTDRLYAN